MLNKIAMWVAAFCVALLIGQWIASTPIPVPCPKGTDNQDSRNQDKQCTSLRSPIFQDQEPVIDKLSEWADGHIGSVTGITTLLLAFVTWRLVTLGQEQSRTAHAELRAYVGVEYPEIKIDGEQILIFVDYKNAGKTPAHDVEFHFDADVVDYGVTPRWRAPLNPDDEGKGGVMLAATVWRRHLPIHGDIAGLVTAMRENRKRIWIWGTIDYVDIFREKCHVQFRLWSSDAPKTDPVDGHEFFSCVSDITHTKATYGRVRP